jgi:endonuclease/exonuclease/phosphatase family metal-dependent hydrolase
VGVIVVASLCVGCAPKLEDHWNNADSFDYPDQPPESLDILSYNVFLRPRSISTSDHTACRGEEIGELLANRDADLVALQESWERHGVDALVDESESKLPFRVLSKPRAAPFKNVSGGLSILSRWPIDDVRTHRYSACNGEDCLASKGILQAVIRVSPSQRVQVVTTHLDAGNQSGDRRARAVQIAELRDFLADIEPRSGPVMLVGDFNVDGVAGGTEYEDLLTSLRANEDFERGESTINCDTNVSCDHPAPPEQLDYVLTLAGENRMFRYQTRHMPLATSACGGEVNYLSDHRAVSATFDLFLRH